MNDTRCGDCVYFAPQMRNTPRGPVAKGFGRCTKRSVNPLTEKGTLDIPDDVRWAEPGAEVTPSDILIVDAVSVRSECLVSIRKR